MFSWLTRRFRRRPDPPTEKARKPTRAEDLLDFVGPGRGFGITSPVWSDVDTLRYNRSWVYAATRLIASRIAAQPVRLGRVATPSGKPAGSKSADSPSWLRPGSVTEVRSHPLLTSLADPNPLATPWVLVYTAVASLQISGTAYLWCDRQAGDGMYLWNLPSGWVNPNYDDPVPLNSFIIRPAGGSEEFLLGADELLRIALPDPADPLGALGPLKAAFPAVVLDDQILLAQQAKFRHGALPGLVVNTNTAAAGSATGVVNDGTTLTASQRRVLSNRIMEWTSGALNAGMPLILDAFIRDVQRFDDGRQELDFGDSSELVKNRIMAVFGVSEISLGLTGDANKASSWVADSHLAQNVLNPLAVLISQTATRFFRQFYRDPTLTLWLDQVQPHDDDAERADRQMVLTAGCVTVNEARAWVGLPPLKDGDQLVKAGPGHKIDLVMPEDARPKPSKSIPEPSLNGVHRG